VVFDEVFYSLRCPDEMVHVHYGEVAFDGAEVHPGDLEVWLVDPEPVEGSGCEGFGGEPGFDDDDSSGLEVAGHVMYGLVEPLPGFDVSYAAEEADDGVEFSFEFKACHVGLVECYVGVFLSGSLEHVRVSV